MPAKRTTAALETTGSPPRPTKASKTRASSSRQVPDESVGHTKHPPPSELPSRSPTRSTVSSRSATDSAESHQPEPHKVTPSKKLTLGAPAKALTPGATMAGHLDMRRPEATREAEKLELARERKKKRSRKNAIAAKRERMKKRGRRGAIAAQGTGSAMRPNPEPADENTYAGMSRSAMSNEVHRRWNAGLTPRDDDYQDEDEDKSAYRTAELEERVTRWLAGMDEKKGFKALEAEDAHTDRRVSESD